MLKLYDWDTVGSPDKLGLCKLDLTAVEPFEVSTLTMPLFEKDGSPGKGEVIVDILFKPEFLNRSRSVNGTFSALPGRALTGIGGVGMAGAKGIGAGAKGVIGVGRFAGKVGHNRT